MNPSEPAGSGTTLQEILTLVKSLQLPDLQTLVDLTTTLLHDRSPKTCPVSLPPEIWKTIFSHTTFPTFSAKSAFYETLATLFSIRTVCTSWNNTIADVLNQFRTRYGFDIPLLKSTFYLTAISGNLKISKYLFNFPALRDSPTHFSLALELSSYFGNFSMTSFLLSISEFNLNSDSEPRDANPFLLAVESGNEKVVQLLLEDSETLDASMNDDQAIRDASYYGYEKIVSMLLHRQEVNPNNFDGYAIGWASACGHIGVVNGLLTDKRVRPEEDNNCAIRWAAENGHVAVVKRLLEDPRVSPEAENNQALELARDRKSVV